MLSRTRRATIAATGALTVVAAVGVTTPTAGASGAEQRVVADVTSGPFHLRIDARRAADTRSTEATGTFDAETSVGPLALMDLHGPVTCLNVRGNRVGLFYPVERSTPSLFARAPTGIFIYLTVDGRGGAKAVSFLPVFSRTTIGCAPLPAYMPATGSATADS